MGGGERQKTTATVTLLQDTTADSALTVENSDNITFDSGEYALLSSGSKLLTVNGGALSIDGGEIGNNVNFTGGEMIQ